MLSITIRSCIEELLEIPESDIIICDNSDEKIWDLLPAVIPGQYIKEGKVKLIRQGTPCLFTARETAIKASTAEYVFCIDGHMLIGHNSIKDLVDFMDRNKDNPKIGFVHAPLTWCHRHESTAVHDRAIGKSELGPWGKYRETEQTITWKGMPWICRRDFFRLQLNGYGALSQHRLSWGGGDMHIGTKPWLLGFENWAVPTRSCIHIGPFPKTVVGTTDYKYRLYSKSGEDVTTLGFLVSCYVLGGEPMMRRNAPLLEEKFKLDIKGNWGKAIKYGQQEREWLQANQTMTYDQYLKDKPWEKGQLSPMN